MKLYFSLGSLLTCEINKVTLFKDGYSKYFLFYFIKFFEKPRCIYYRLEMKKNYKYIDTSDLLTWKK